MFNITVNLGNANNIKYSHSKSKFYQFCIYFLKITYPYRDIILFDSNKCFQNWLFYLMWKSNRKKHLRGFLEQFSMLSQCIKCIFREYLDSTSQCANDYDNQLQQREEKTSGLWSRRAFHTFMTLWCAPEERHNEPYGIRNRSCTDWEWNGTWRWLHTAFTLQFACLCVSVSVSIIYLLFRLFSVSVSME